VKGDENAMSSSRRPDLEAYLGFKLSPELTAKIHQLVEQCVDERLEKILTEKLEEIVKKCLEEREKLAEKEILKLRKVPHKEAVALIKKYIDEHQGCRTSDIIYDLALDPDLVLSVLTKLEKKKVIRGE